MIPNETTSTPRPQSASTVNTGTEGAQSNVHNGVNGKFSGGATPMMSFGQAVSTCLKKYATFKGRARRSEYWWFALFNWIVLVAVCIVTVCAEVACGAGSTEGPRAGGTVVPGVLGVLLALVLLALIVPTISVSVRRFHDTGHSGWVYLALLIGGCMPFINIITSIAGIIYCCKDSNRGENAYGPSPKYPNS